MSERPNPYYQAEELADRVFGAEQDANQVADALDEIDTGLADAIEFRHEGKEMATDFYEGLREVARKALDKHREQVGGGD